MKRCSAAPATGSGPRVLFWRHWWPRAPWPSCSRPIPGFRPTPNSPPRRGLGWNPGDPKAGFRTSGSCWMPDYRPGCSNACCNCCNACMFRHPNTSTCSPWRPAGITGPTCPSSLRPRAGPNPISPHTWPTRPLAIRLRAGCSGPSVALHKISNANWPTHSWPSVTAVPTSTALSLPIPCWDASRPPAERPPTCLRRRCARSPPMTPP